MPVYVYVAIPVIIVGHFSPDFASVNNYSMRRLRISNRMMSGNLLYGPERSMCHVCMYAVTNLVLIVESD